MSLPIRFSSGMLVQSSVIPVLLLLDRSSRVEEVQALCKAADVMGERRETSYYFHLIIFLS